MKPLQEKEIRKALARISPLRFSRECFHRNVSARGYTEFRVDPLDADHSRIVGNRYNFAGAFPVLYLAHHATLATLEAEKDYIRLGLPFDEACRINVPLRISGPFLDLTSSSNRRLLGVTPKMLTLPTVTWKAIQASGQEAPTQTLGRLVFESKRFGGIYFPSVESARLEDLLTHPNNLAVFMKKRKPSQPLHLEVRLELPDPQDFLKTLAKKFLGP